MTRYSWLAPIGFTLIGYSVFSRFLVTVSSLPEVAYQNTWITAEFVKHLVSSWWLIPVLVPVGLLLIWRRRQMLHRWNQFEHGNLLRTIIIVSAFLITWNYSTYAFNYNANQLHLIDRLLLLALLIAIFFRPIFVFPFLLCMLPMTGQFSLLYGWFSWAPIDLPLNLLFLFASFLFFQLAFNWKNSSHFFLISFCLIGGHYWMSGLAKIRIDWLSLENVQYLLPATYSNGWLGFLSPETIGRISNIIAPLNPFIKVSVVAVECMGPLLFLGRRLSAVVIILWILFHLGVFLLSGIFFWHWIAINFSILILVWKRNLYEVTGTLPYLHRILGIILIILSPFWVRTTPLAWIGSKINYVYRFEVWGQSGQPYTLPPLFFLPFEYPFTMGRFTFLTDKPTLSVTWGATDPKTGRHLNQTTTPKDVLLLEESIGKDFENQQQSQWFKNFLSRCIQNKYTDQNKSLFKAISASPPVIWTYSDSRTYKGQESVDKIKVSRELWFFNGEKPEKISNIDLLELDLTGS